jgi:hypothetical protein
MHKNSEEISKRLLSEVLPPQDGVANGTLKREPVPYGPATGANALNNPLRPAIFRQVIF